MQITTVIKIVKMYSNLTYKDFNINASKTSQKLRNNEDVKYVSFAKADDKLVKCLICMKVIKNVNNKSIECHFKSTHNIIYELPILMRMTVAVGIDIKIEKIYFIKISCICCYLRTHRLTNHDSPYLQFALIVEKYPIFVVISAHT